MSFSKEISCSELTESKGCRARYVCGGLLGSPQSTGALPARQGSLRNNGSDTENARRSLAFPTMRTLRKPSSQYASGLYVLAKLRFPLTIGPLPDLLEAPLAACERLSGHNNFAHLTSCFIRI